MAAQNYWLKPPGNPIVHACTQNYSSDLKPSKYTSTKQGQSLITGRAFSPRRFFFFTAAREADIPK